MQLDFNNRIYTVEILKSNSDHNTFLNSIESCEFVSKKRYFNTIQGDIELYRYDIVTNEKLYRSSKPDLSKKLPYFEGGLYHYDFIICRKQNLILLAVPYTQLALEFFSKLDYVFSNYDSGISNYSYAKVNISELLIAAGENAEIHIKSENEIDTLYQVTECTLKYNFAENSKITKQTIKIYGDNLSHSSQYKDLISPILNKKSKINAIDIEPLSMSFNYQTSLRRKCSCYTDRHGNFRIRIGKKIESFMYLIQAINELNRTFSSIQEQTPNLPIKSMLDDDQ
ncbi:hypothetical protein EA770_07170 [Acinetobacter baumannii]|nr:hypothetical protein EA770_07170 [Acinetobacter baumannii]